MEKALKIQICILCLVATMKNTTGESLRTKSKDVKNTITWNTRREQGEVSSNVQMTEKVRIGEISQNIPGI